MTASRTSRADLPASARPRRTQEERRAETRAKLLDATIESLLEVGYPGTTTRRVSELAGVSLGAQTHHFPHRADLVAAAVERLAGQRVEHVRSLARELPRDGADRFAALLDLLWADFSSDLFTVFVKLWVAAADDPELYERMVEVERWLARVIGRFPAEVLSDLPAAPDLEARMVLVLSAMRGLALADQFEPRRGRRRDLWPVVRAALLESLASVF